MNDADFASFAVDDSGEYDDDDALTEDEVKGVLVRAFAGVTVAAVALAALVAVASRLL